MASEHSLPDLEAPDRFVGRHVGPDDGEQARMLDALGLSSRISPRSRRDGSRRCSTSRPW